MLSLVLILFSVPLYLRILFLMALERICTVDGISSSCIFSGKIFMMPFLCKMEKTMNTLKSVIVKINRYDIF